MGASAIPHADAMLAALRRSGAPMRSADLQRQLGISQPTASRALAALVLAGQACKLGQGRGLRYGLPRHIGGLGHSIAVAQVDRQGCVQSLGSLLALQGGGFWVEGEALRKPLGGEAYHDGLPWLVQDMRPQGFLGRSLARAHAGHSLGPDPRQWSDDDLLRAIGAWGDDLPGNLIVGEAALQRHLQRSRSPLLLAAPEDYPALAAAAMAGAVPGSSAGGEQPKFCCLDGQGRSWIVKFSPAGDNPVAQRVRHLLRCEHLALQVLREAGQPAALTRCFEREGRVFMAALRFDRSAPDLSGHASSHAPGRIGMASLQAYNAEYAGPVDQWARTAQRLRERGLLSGQAARSLKLWDAFGQLIANTDRHYGNVSLLWDGRRWALAPCYDMLPMRFMPMQGEVPAWEWDMQAVQPSAATLEVWPEAQALARRFWAQVPPA